MKIIVFIISFLIQIIAAVIGGFMLLLGLNGFSSKQAEPSLFLYGALSVISALVLGVVSIFVEKRLENTSLGKIGAVLITIAASAIIGVVILIIGFFAALFLADAMRGK